MTTQFSRRSFLGGALSFGALAGCRAFRAPAGLFAGDGAKLVLGVVSDIHVDCGRGDFKKFGDAAQFEKALRWFDAQGVDGVVVAGDMADNGMVNQLEAVGEAWFRVFPEGRSAADGRPVEQLFVYGNHDFEGQRYDGYAERFVEPESFKAGQIVTDPAAAWERVFHEKYAPIWIKEVKGYQFVGAHWVSWNGVPAVEPWFRDHAAAIRRDRPFFFIQHCHPKDTVYGNEAWCADKGYATRALSAFPNAVAFSGHSHTPLTDERSIWQGAFTSIGTSSLRYGGNSETTQWDQRQGMLVKVYDDRIVVARRDFLHDVPLADDWVIPLPLPGERPFAFAARKAKSSAPEFAPGAKVTAKRHTRKIKELDKEKRIVFRTEPGWKLEIPCANAGKTRAFRYEISTGVNDPKGKPAVFLACDAQYNMPRALAGAPTNYIVDDCDLAPGAQPKFSVVALDSFGNRSAPLVCDGSLAPAPTTRP